MRPLEPFREASEIPLADKAPTLYFVVRCANKLRRRLRESPAETLQVQLVKKWLLKNIDRLRIGPLHLAGYALQSDHRQKSYGDRANVHEGRRLLLARATEESASLSPEEERQSSRPERINRSSSGFLDSDSDCSDAESVDDLTTTGHEVFRSNKQAHIAVKGSSKAELDNMFKSLSETDSLPGRVALHMRPPDAPRFSCDFVWKKWTFEVLYILQCSGQEGLAAVRNGPGTPGRPRPPTEQDSDASAPSARAEPCGAPVPLAPPPPPGRGGRYPAGQPTKQDRSVPTLPVVGTSMSRPVGTKPERLYELCKGGKVM